MNPADRTVTICPDCGAAAWGRPDYCRGCGRSLRGVAPTPLPDEDETCALCPVCGAAIPVSAAFCPACGAAQRYPAQYAQGEGAPSERETLETQPQTAEVYGPPPRHERLDCRVDMAKMLCVYAPPELMGKRGRGRKKKNGE